MFLLSSGRCCMYGTFLLPPPNQCILAWCCFPSLVEEDATCMARSSSASYPLPTSVFSHVSSLVEDAGCMASSSSASCPLPTSAILHGDVFPLLWKMLHVWHVPPLSPAPSQPVQSRIVLFLSSSVSCFMYGTFLFTESLF